MESVEYFLGGSSKENERFLLKEGRSKGLSFDKAYRLFLENCTEYRAFLTQIFRGVDGFEMDYGVVKPKQAARRRKSAYTKNYYTLIIDNSKHWNDFPDRGESIICSTDPKTAMGYGTLYLVVPYDNANLGIAPKVDIWQSFDIQLKKFNEVIENIGKVSFRYRNKSYNEPPQDNFKGFKNYLIKVGKVLEESEFGLDVLAQQRQTQTFVKKYLNMKSEFDNFYEYIEWFFNPHRNDFERRNYNSNFGITWRQEVWTDSPSLLIKYDKVHEFFGKVNDSSDREIDNDWLRMSHDDIT